MPTAEVSATIPNLHDILLDETDGFPEEVVTAAGGVIWGRYISDLNTHVHAAELTPSYELAFVAYETPDAPTDEKAREDFDEVLRGSAPDSDVVYVHTHLIDGLPDTRKRPIEVTVALEDLRADRAQTVQAIIDECVEHARGNGWGVVPPPPAATPRPRPPAPR